MRLTPARNNTVRIAVMAASVALLAAACAKGTANNPGTIPTSKGEGITLTRGTLLISDGSPKVRIGEDSVTFPGPVSDAVWSPDGSRIAYIDGNGNVATAKPDGSDVLVLTQTNPSVTRSRPTWLRQWMLFAEKKGDGTSAIMSVPTNGCGFNGYSPAATEWPMDTGDGTSYVDLAPSASQSFRPTRFVFQHEEPSGHQIWINDTNRRVPFTMKFADGSEPALSLDATKLAFVGPDGAIYASTATHGEYPAATKISLGPVSRPSHLTWSPDGSHLAYETSADVEEVAYGGSNPPTVLSNKPGAPSYLAGTQNVVNTITGADPTALSVAASRARWEPRTQYFQAQGYSGALSAIVATAAEATGAAGITGNLGPVLLLSSGNALDQSVKDELHRAFGVVSNESIPTVYVTAGVSAAVANQLRQLGYQVQSKPLGSAPTFPSGVCGPQAGTQIFEKVLTVVDGKDAAAVGIGAAIAASVEGPVISVNGPLSDDQIAYLSHSAGAVDTVDVIGAVSADVVAKIGDLVSGPIGFQTQNNPEARPLS
jgi:hypothetical protein